MRRTHNNGELRSTHLNQTVELLGWVSKKRNLGSLVFIDLRDRYGITQVVCDASFSTVTDQIKNEFVLHIEGKVQIRQNTNVNLSTGEIEVTATKVTIINTAEPTPLIVAEETDALEDTRMKYRYLDLRRPSMQRKMVIRHQITKSVRNYLDRLDFIEIETPLLTKPTPEGARDYLVPSRVNPGKFYSLPQSPQLFKQLLMISGFEKYYQIARCFRDEDLRSDRQPDFTQVDLEVSFMSEDEIMSLLESLFASVLKEVKGFDLVTPLRRITYDDAMNRYGSDKPDTRFPLELIDLYHVLKDSESVLLKSVVDQGGILKGLLLPQLSSQLSRKDFDGFTELAKKHRVKNVVWGRVTSSGLEGPMAKLVREQDVAPILQTLNAHDGDAIVIIADNNWTNTCNALGTIRNHVGKRYFPQSPTNYDVLWIVGFPLFEFNPDKNGLDSTHHPFTRPHQEDIPYLDTDPTKIRAHHYDLVMNGYELGSGSLRIYDMKMQEKVFQIIGLSDEEIHQKFSFFIDAFKYGTPPHGGFAFGLDRVAMILTESDSIRDVIAFPKNASAVCPLTNAPTEIEGPTLEKLGIKGSIV